MRQWQLSTTGGYYINPTRGGAFFGGQFTENTASKDRPHIDTNLITTQLADHGIIPITPQFNGVRRGSDNNYYLLRDGKYYKVTIDNLDSPVLEGLDTYIFYRNTPVKVTQSTDLSVESTDAAQTATNTDSSSANADNNKTQYKGYFAANGLGDYQSLAARKKWIADNKDWLSGQGFNSATYDMSGAVNQRLVQLIKKKQAEDANPVATVAATSQTTVTNPAVTTQQPAVTPAPKTYTAQQLLAMSEADATAAGAKNAWAEVLANKLNYDDYNSYLSSYAPGATWQAGWDVTRAAMDGYGQDALTRNRFRLSYNNYMQNRDNFSSDEKMRNYLRSLSPAERLRQKRIHENMGQYQQYYDAYMNNKMAGQEAVTWDPNKVYTISLKNGGRLNYFNYFE